MTTAIVVSGDVVGEHDSYGAGRVMVWSDSSEA